MKFFTAMFSHETSTFSPIPTSRKNFEAMYYHRPGPNPDLAAEQATDGPNSQWIRAALHNGHTIVPGLSTTATPSGRLSRVDYEALRGEILDDLRHAMPVDAVLLLLHGAQMAVGYDDCEGDLIERVRAIVGPRVPIGVELDLHCNVSDAMVHHATVLLACKEYPHTDFGERAVELFHIIEATAQGKVKPVTAFERVPMLGLYLTPNEPMRGFVDRVLAMEGKDKILAITLAHGFAYADVRDASASVVVVTDGEPDLARGLARQLGREFFALRGIAGPKLLSIDATLERALATPPGKPTVVADGSDNPGGGAPGDSTFILRAILDRGIRDAAVGVLWDPVAAQIARDAGPGSRLAMRIGGKMGPASGHPLDVEAEVLAVVENPRQTDLSGRRDGMLSELGLTAALRVNGVDIVVNSKRVQTFSPDCFTELGVDPLRKRLVVVKSTQHFYAHFAPIARQILYCDAPGAQSSDFKGRDYRNLRRPMWPLDDVTY